MEALLEFLPTDLVLLVDFLTFGDCALKGEVISLISTRVLLVTRDAKAILVQQAGVALLPLPPTGSPIWIVQGLFALKAVELADGHFAFQCPKKKRSEVVHVCTRQGQLVQALHARAFTRREMISSVTGHVALGQPTEDNRRWRFANFGATAPLVESKEDVLFLPCETWMLGMKSIGSGVWRATHTEHMIQFSPQEGKLSQMRLNHSLMADPKLIMFLPARCVAANEKKVVLATIKNDFGLQKTKEVSLPASPEPPMAVAFFDGVLHIVHGPPYQDDLFPPKPYYVLRPNHRRSRLRLPGQYQRAQFVVHGRNLYTLPPPLVEPRGLIRGFFICLRSEKTSAARFSGQ